ncbi:MAG: DUF2062 domain-containing protein [Desulfocapsaceae bacterium]|nr:DUF2062 domain-containing protein [Desulfocapsaceae bacterium]
MKLNRLGKYYYLKFIRLKGDPKSLAVGTAIGVFVGLTPTMPLHTIVILVLTLVTRSSMIAAMTISWLICNPLTYIPIYAVSVKIGNALTPYNLCWAQIKDVLNFLLSHPGVGPSLKALADLGWEAIAVLLVGGCVLALPFTVVSYYLSLSMFVKIRKKRMEKHILK